MKFKILTISLIYIFSISIAQNKNIQFETGSFADLKAKAQKENKLIFIDAYTVWCGPCKWMAKNIFTNDTVADFYNSKFINAQIDMEKGEGVEIAKLYNVHCYPSLLYIDGDGKLIHRGAGSSNAQRFINLGENSLIPEKTFSRFESQYESKRTDAKFLSEYLYAISETCLPYKDVLADYIKTQKDEELFNRANWNIIRDFSSDYKSREFKYLLDNVEIFNNLYTADSVNSKIKTILINSGQNIIYKKELKEEEYTKFKNEIKNIKFANIEEILFRTDLAYYNKKEDWKKYFNLAVEQGDKFYNGVNEFNEISWSIYENSDDIKVIQKAAEWMKKALVGNENKEWAAHDTYASLLFKLKKYEESKTEATKAIEIAKAAGVSEDDYKPTLELIEKIGKIK